MLLLLLLLPPLLSSPTPSVHGSSACWDQAIVKGAKKRKEKNGLTNFGFTRSVDNNTPYPSSDDGCRMFLDYYCYYCCFVFLIIISFLFFSFLHASCRFPC